VLLIAIFAVTAILTGLACTHSYLYSMMVTMDIKQVSLNIISEKILNLNAYSISKAKENRQNIQEILKDLEFFDLFYFITLITSSWSLIVCVLVIFYMHA
jgi:hypothetical protein